jgi:hypothetical protein
LTLGLQDHHVSVGAHLLHRVLDGRRWVDRLDLDAEYPDAGDRIVEYARSWC